VLSLKKKAQGQLYLYLFQTTPRNLVIIWCLPWSCYNAEGDHREEVQTFSVPCCSSRNQLHFTFWVH